MNPDRSTVEETPLGLLNVVQRGGTEDWKELYEKCHDPAVARQLAEILKLGDPDLAGSLRVWKFLLEDLHPGLGIALR